MDPAQSSRQGFLERLSTLLTRVPEDREHLLEQLHTACDRNVIDAETLAMIEGALNIYDAQVGDIMVSSAQMHVLSIDDSIEKIAAFAIETTHSRFPVIDGNRDNVVGIFLAKDLLHHYAGQSFDWHDKIRPAVFVPESKRLNVLLREFRASRNHMAIVVDEYGSVAGLVTIEDVLEQVVGDIEDEYDFDHSALNIRQGPNGLYRVRGETDIEDFNEAFGTDFSDEDVDTISGLITHELGRMPARGEVVEMVPVRFRVIAADGRRIRLLLAERIEAADDADTDAD